METQKLPKFKIRCHAIHRIMGGSIGLTEAQEELLKDYNSRINGTHPKGLKMTTTMTENMVHLVDLRDNPRLPEGAKTYCKEWVKQVLYGRKAQVSSKQVEKGHNTEEDGFTSMCVQLNLGMVFKNENFVEDEYMTGTCDLDKESLDTVYDNKSSWSLDQFPMFENECPDPKYIQQVKGYAHLYKRGKAAVVYTLNNIDLDQLGFLLKSYWSDNEKRDYSLQLIYSEDVWEKAKERFFPNADPIDFVEIPESKRVKAYFTEADPSFIADVQQRVKMCREYIKTLLK